MEELHGLRSEKMGALGTGSERAGRRPGRGQRACRKNELVNESAVAFARSYLVHHEVDRLFDDAFRGFGGRWPRLTLDGGV